MAVPLKRTEQIFQEPMFSDNFDYHGQSNGQFQNWTI